MWWPFRKEEKKQEERGHIDLAVDRHGNRYTSHAFAVREDPWYGARILTRGCVERLRREGLLPLKEVDL